MTAALLCRDTSRRVEKKGGAIFATALFFIRNALAFRRPSGTIIDECILVERHYSAGLTVRMAV